MDSNLALNIKELLKIRRMTQKELSIRCDVSEMSISRYIKGERIPNAEVLEKMATALNVTTDNLLSRNKEVGYIEILNLASKYKKNLTEEEKYNIIKELLS